VSTGDAEAIAAVRARSGPWMPSEESHLSFVVDGSVNVARRAGGGDVVLTQATVSSRTDRH